MDAAGVRRSSAAGRIVAALLVPASLVFLVPVHAAALRCATKELAPAEAQRALARARRLPGLWQAHLVSACVSATASIVWIESPRRTEAHDLVAWTETRCRRMRTRWACRAPVRRRHLALEIFRRGSKLSVDARLDEHTEPARARALVPLAYSLVLTPRADLARCSPSDTPAELAQPDEPGPWDEHVELFTAGDVTRVVLWSRDRVAIRFDAGGTPACWDPPAG